MRHPALYPKDSTFDTSASTLAESARKPLRRRVNAQQVFQDPRILQMPVDLAKSGVHLNKLFDEDRELPAGQRFCPSCFDSQIVCRLLQEELAPCHAHL